MQKVTIRLINIQSHEDTLFHLDAGINFITSPKNNVGKSTVFRLLKCLASYPNVQATKLASLIRWGQQTARAYFSYGDIVTVATLYRGTKGREATRMLVEHYVDGTDSPPIRMERMPSDWYEALGIYVDEVGTPINFNDANSVQLIANTSVDADNIIALVLIDANVERVKTNLYQLKKEMATDLRQYTQERDSAVNRMQELTYHHLVDEFNEKSTYLELLAKVLDSLPDTDTSWWGDCEVMADELPYLDAGMSILSNLGRADLLTPTPVADLSRIDALASVVRKIPAIDEVKEATLSEDLATLMGVCKRLHTAYRELDTYDENAKKVHEMRITMNQLLATIEMNAKKVVCPVRGEVYYGGKECLPIIT